MSDKLVNKKTKVNTVLIKKSKIVLNKNETLGINSCIRSGKLA